MSLCKFLLLLTVLSLRFDLAYSIFGAEDVLLEEYYEFGKCQTGVASVIARDNPRDVKAHFGTANLIDVGTEHLKGRLLITAAHVIGGRDAESSYIRFIDENNVSQNVEVQKFFVPSKWRTKGQDIGFILLKESVNIEKFKPLKLNISKDNRSFYGKSVNVLGCTPVFGKAHSKVVIRESESGLLRRGMTAIVHEDDKDTSELTIFFYSNRLLSGNKSLVKIFRSPTYCMEEVDQERVHEIEVQLKECDTLIENEKSDIERFMLFGRRSLLSNELFNLSTNSKKILARQGLCETIFYNEEFEAQLEQLQDTDDFNKLKLRTEWEKFVNDQRYGTKTLKIDAYTIQFYGPQPRLSGQSYFGDSGGAWVIDDEIVGISKVTSFAVPYKDLHLNRKSPEQYETLPAYFAECEDIISQSPPVTDVKLSTSYATSIWDCRVWIESTLEKISQLIGS